MNQTTQMHNPKKKGYLHNDLETFYILDKTLPTFEYHYHDFYKLLIHIQGEVSYLIEGKVYTLVPGDTILINPGEIHKPSIHNNAIYERIIAYISDTFFERMASYDIDLKQCFTLAKANHSHLVRSNLSQGVFNQISDVIKSSFISQDYGNHLLRRIKIEEYLIMINRIINFQDDSFIQPTITNEKVLLAIDFINKNIDKDLSMENIATNLFVHKSYLMHLFKKKTGYTIGKYINEKRLFIANQYIQSGKNITEACYLSGFQNYGTFYYAYKKRYGNSPRKTTIPFDSNIIL